MNFFHNVKKKVLTYEFFSIILPTMKIEMKYLKEKLGTWKRVSEVLDITPRYCYMIYNTGKCGRHLRKLINQKVELFK